MKQPINYYTGKCACRTTASKGMDEGGETQGDLTIQGWGRPWAARGARHQEGLEEARQRRLWQIFSISSGPWEICSGPGAGRHAFSHSTCTGMGFRDAQWEPLSWAGAQQSLWPHHSTSACCPPSCEDQTGCTMGSSPIMVASAGPMGSGGWNLPHHNCIPKYTTLCSYCKLHWGFHMLNFQCFVNRNYSQVFQELERSTRLCISLWLRLGNNLTDLDFVNVHNWFFTQNEFISKYNIGLMGLIENSGAFSCSIYLVLTMHVVVGSGYKIGVCEKNYFISPHFQGHL